MQTTPAQNQTFTGRHMAIILVTFFTVVIGVNVTMAMLARRSWTGLVVPNTYVASQQFNAETSRREGMKARGEKIKLRFENDRLSLAVLDKSGNTIPVLSSTLKLVHNVTVNQEATITLTCSQQNCFATPDLAPGLWRGDMRLHISGQEPYQQSIEIYVKDK